MTDFHKWVVRWGIWSKSIMIILLYIIWTFSFWALESERKGDEIAMILGAVLVPMVGLFKMVLEFSDRKKQTSENDG